jgi:AraC family transcriptional regulator, transcriptional activator of pobA
MEYTFRNRQDAGEVILKIREDKLQRYFSETNSDNRLYSIAWNKGPRQTVTIDEIGYEFGPNTVLPIMMSQSFRFQNPADIVIWQFNREFYCIANHDAEVGCVGFIFYGPTPAMFVQMEEEHTATMNQLLALFEEEFLSAEDIKGEMLRMLLVRLIIQITRLAKKQYLGTTAEYDDKFNLIRQFNLQVEIHYRNQHQVRFYAGLLNKSPKTISNIFSLYSKKSPTQVIQERIIAEAKRLFYYTDKPVKEIADILGFEDVAHFSKFFKNCTSQSPSYFKKVSKTGN